jgi:hypothetical protein
VSAKTVTIDHPHAEVIAAYYSGKTVQFRSGEWPWNDLNNGVPSFERTLQWRIKPEPLVRWVVVDGDANNVAWDSLKSAEEMVERYANLYRASNFRIVRMVEQPE